MDFFSGYGSDSDNEQPSKSVSVPAAVQPKIQPSVVQQVKVQPKAVIPAPRVASKAGSSSSGGVVQKKVKKLDISFLPAEIQAALARGDSTRDSDDDEAGPVTSTTQTKVSKSANKPVDAASSLLLGMLPAPKVYETDKPAPSSSSGGNTKAPAAPLVPNAATKGPPAVKPTPAAAAHKSTFSFGYSSTETVRTGQGKTGSVTVSVDSKPDVPVMPWFQDIQKPIEAVRPPVLCCFSSFCIL